MRNLILAAACGTLFFASVVTAEEYRTTHAHEHGQPEIVFSVTRKSVPDVDRQWAVATLEGMVKGGSRFKAGETMQLGWMLTRFEQNADGTLRLQEPDMRAPSIVFVDGLDTTLVHVRAQRDTVDSFVEQPTLSYPSIRESIFVPPEYRIGPEFYLERHTPEDSDSGWVLIAGTQPPTAAQLDEYRRVSLYSFAKQRPTLLNLLALPPGSTVKVDGDGVRHYFFQEKPLTVKPGSFVQAVDAIYRRGAYHAKVANHVMAHWKMPKAAPPGTRCETKLSLSPKGEITGLDFLSCPEDAALRTSIQQAVRKANPVPAPIDPADYLEALAMNFMTTDEY